MTIDIISVDSPRYNAAHLLVELAARYPRTFFLAGPDRRPLKIRINRDLRAVRPQPYSRTQLERFFRFYTTSVDYLAALKAGAARLDLAGNVAGHVSEAEAADAVERAARYAARQAERLQEARAAHQSRQVSPPRAQEAQEPPPQRASLPSKGDSLAALRATARARRASS
jgi:ProP effector